MFKIVTLFLLLVSLSGCTWWMYSTTGEKMALLEPGMTQKEVVKILGKPDGFQQRSEFTIYKYVNRLISGWSGDKTDYSLIFKDNKLIEYGAGEVRERSNGGVYSLFIYQMQ